MTNASHSRCFQKPLFSLGYWREREQNWAQAENQWILVLPLPPPPLSPPGDRLSALSSNAAFSCLTTAQRLPGQIPEYLTAPHPSPAESGPRISQWASCVRPGMGVRDTVGTQLGQPCSPCLSPCLSWTPSVMDVSYAGFSKKPHCTHGSWWGVRQRKPRLLFFLFELWE